MAARRKHHETDARGESPPVRKLVALDRETWQAVDVLGRDSMKSFQELTDEAFRDLLKKHGRVDTLMAALRQSAAAPEGAVAPTGARPGRARRRRHR